MVPAPVLTLALIAALALAGCVFAPEIKILGYPPDPLQEIVLEGTAEDKVLLVPIRGVIDTEMAEDPLRTKPGLLQETVSQLRLAEADPRVKAVVLLIDSPGGTVAASEILHHELAALAERGGKRLVACQLGVAASGGYYASAAAELIVAHPGTVTGSVGTIFIRPKVHGLMDKLGLAAEVTASGEHKDMLSPFRPTTPEEEAQVAAMIADMNARFLEVVAKSRGLSPEAVQQVAKGGIFSAPQALALGLVDQVGFVDDAIDAARTLAGLPAEARVVAYRRSYQPDDNAYNLATSSGGSGLPVLADLGLAGYLDSPRPGFHHLWLAGAMGR